MAIHAPITGAPTRAPSNVTRLPTAARRQPPNHRYAAQFSAGAALREEQGSPFLYKRPWERERQAEIGLCRSPELLIVLALCKALTPEQRREIATHVAKVHFVVGDDISLQACRIMEALG